MYFQIVSNGKKHAEYRSASFIRHGRCSRKITTSRSNHKDHRAIYSSLYPSREFDSASIPSQYFRRQLSAQIDSQRRKSIERIAYMRSIWGIDCRIKIIDRQLSERPFEQDIASYVQLSSEPILAMLYAVTFVCESIDRRCQRIRNTAKPFRHPCGLHTHGAGRRGIVRSERTTQSEFQASGFADRISSDQNDAIQIENFVPATMKR